MIKSLIKALLLCCILPVAASGQTSFPLVEISEVAPTIIKEIRYAVPHNFVGEQVDGYSAAKCYLTESAAEALASVQKKLIANSFSLKIFDCYRPQRAVDHFVRWAAGEGATITKEFYFPNVPADSLFAYGYIADRSGHSRGSTVDLTIVRLPYVAPTNFEYSCLDENGYQFRGSELNMGTSYDCFDARSHTFSTLMPDSILANRKLLLEVMQAQGFVNYSKEWWHFTFKPEEFPDTIFDVPIE